MSEQMALVPEPEGVRHRPAALPSDVPPADHLPVARVLVETSLAHLDRPFDYLVPAQLDDSARPGCRVRVRLAGRDHDGVLLERVAEADHAGRLAPLRTVVSPEPVLTPEVEAATRMVADHYGGAAADVLRLAVPPRHARAERSVPPRERSDAVPPTAAAEEAGADPWAPYPAGAALLRRIADGQAPAASWLALPGRPPGQDWPDAVASAVAAALGGGRGSVVVVPDHRDVRRVLPSLVAAVGEDTVAQLTADLGPEARYRAFLRILRGHARVVVGTRSAAFAPVSDLGLLVCWDEGDDLHQEPRSPYPHVREVLRLRAAHEGAALLLGGFTRSVTVQQWVEGGTVAPVTAGPSALRAGAPAVVVAGEGWQEARDEGARTARIPSLAWRTLKDGLTRGPVLVQVPRHGYVVSLACQECRAPVRCARCAGPVGAASPGVPDTCRWCGSGVPAALACPACGSRRRRATGVGERRTAEELGRAFPGTLVRTSGGEHVLHEVGPEPALVVATPGAEPWCPGGVCRSRAPGRLAAARAGQHRCPGRGAAPVVRGSGPGTRCGRRPRRCRRDRPGTGRPVRGASSRAGAGDRGSRPLGPGLAGSQGAAGADRPRPASRASPRHGQRSARCRGGGRRGAVPGRSRGAGRQLRARGGCTRVREPVDRDRPRGAGGGRAAAGDRQVRPRRAQRAQGRRRAPGPGRPGGCGLTASGRRTAATCAKSQMRNDPVTVRSRWWRLAQVHAYRQLATPRFAEREQGCGPTLAPPGGDRPLGGTLKIRRATMAVVAAGALALAGCTSDTGTDTETPTAGDTAEEPAGDDTEETGTAGDDAEETTGSGDGTDDGAAAGDTAKADLGDITTNNDIVSFSSGAEEYNAYNGDTAGTNSTYNAVVNNQLQSGFWYWGTDGTVYPNEWFGQYEQTSDDPLTVEYTISDDAVWSDGTPITSNDFLLNWASTNPDYLFGDQGGDDAAATSAPAEDEGEEGEEAANSGEFSPVSDWSTYATQPPETEPSSKTFTVVYDEPYPDWEIAVSGALPSHVAAEQAGLSGDELAQAILDGDGETVNGVAQFWNEGWLFPNFQVEDESLVPSSGPYTLEGASWQSGTQLTLVPNESFFGPPPATGNLMFRFAAPETHVQGLLNGDINVIDPQATVDTRQQLENAGDSITVETGDAMTWEHLDFNFNEGSIFSDDEGGLAAREAFALCVPRQGIVDSLIKPINEEAELMNLRERFPFQEDYAEVVEAAYDGRYDEVNIEEARAKFEESGLEEGVTVRIGYSAPNQRRTEEVAAIKASCDEVGFTIEDSGDATFFQAGGPLEVGDWEVALFAWAGSGQIASGKGIYETDGNQNYGGFSNAEVDQAWETLATSVDPEVHLEQTKIIEKLLWDNLYGLPLFAHPSMVGYDATLENVRDTAVQTGVSWNAEQWVRAS